jgi:hypothetical protein
MYEFLKISPIMEVCVPSEIFNTSSFCMWFMESMRKVRFMYVRDYKT